MNIKTIALLLCLIAGSISLTACGIKPGFVSAPPEVEHDTFPHTYPNPATDPAQ